MPAKHNRDDQFDWRLPLYGALASAAIGLSLILSPADLTGIAFIMYCLLLIPVVALGFLWIVLWTFFDLSRWRKSLSLVALPLTYWIVAFAFGFASDRIAPSERWLLHANRLKAAVLRLPSPPDGQLKHVDWDTWGFAGEDTVAYLVFDPTDDLAAAARSHSTSRVRGIPCEVPKVRRLERRWYVVTFYTDWDWEHCG